MKVSFTTTRMALLLLGITVVMTGCFGLFSSKPTPSPPVPTVLEGTLSGPAGLIAESDGSVALNSDTSQSLWHQLATFSRQFIAQPVLASLRLLPGEQALPGVPVAVYELGKLQADPVGTQPLLSGSTDANGKFAFADVPTGKDLVIVTLTKPRMTTVVPSPGRETTVTMNSATSLASEALIHDLREQGGTVDPNRWGRAVADIEAFLDDFDLDQDALLDALDALIPDDFGQGIPEMPPASWLPLADAVMDAIIRNYDGTYDVRGIVFDQNENGVPGVEISFSGDYESVFTDANGNWYKDGLVGEVTVTAVENDTFKRITSEWMPLSQTVTESTWITFFGEVLVLVDPPYSVSGHVKWSDGSPLEGVTIDVYRHEETVVTDGSGAFTVSNLGFHTTVTPKKEGFIFQPSSIMVTGAVTDLQFTALSVEEAAIEFADPNLEAAVRETLKYYMDDPDGPITFDLVPKATMITSWDNPIRDLSGIEHFVNLDTFYLGYSDNSELDDLSPLADLENLRMVLISNSSVSDLSPLSHKPRIQDLTLNNNQIEDISVIATLPTLSTLKLNDNPLSDLSPLEMWNPTSQFGVLIELKNTHITDVAALRHINLSSLYLNDNEYLTDISDLLATPVTYLQLLNTPALDWCDYESTWYVVDTLRRRESTRVFTDSRPCLGAYELSGIIELNDLSDHDPDQEFYVVFRGNQSAWSAEAELWGDYYGWEQTVEGTVSIEPRVRSTGRTTSSPWTFEPGQKLNVNRPERNITFTAYRHALDTPIVQGHVEDSNGNPIPGVEITLVDDITNDVLATLTTDEFGYFDREFDGMTWLNVYAEKDGWYFYPVLGINTPKLVRMVGLPEAGGTIAFVRDGTLRTVLPNGNEDTEIADIGEGMYYGTANGVAWSPGASELVYASGWEGQRELRIVNRDGSSDRLLFGHADVDVRGATWNSFNEIMYSYRRVDGPDPVRNPWHLKTTSPTGGEGNTLLEDAGTHYLHARWSPDNLRIAVAMWETGNSGEHLGIHIIEAHDPNNPVKIDDGMYPAWSPSSVNKLAYTRDGDIYVYDLGNKTSDLFVIDGTHPTWSPDGKFIAFERNGHIYIADLEGNLEPVRIVEGTEPVWSPL